MNLPKSFVLILILCYAAMDVVPVLSDDGRQLDSRSTSYDDFLPDVTRVQYQCLCVKGHEFVHKLNVTIDEALACIAPTLASIISPSRNWVNELTDLTEKEKLQSAIETSCHAMSEVKRCGWDLINLMTQCYAREEKENLKGITNAAFKAADYLCYLKGVRYIEILQAKVQQCASSREDGLNQCWKDFTTLKKDPDLAIIPFNRKTCRVIKDAAFCTVTELSSCVGRKSTEIMRELVKTVLKELPCEKFSYNYNIHRVHLLH